MLSLETVLMATDLSMVTSTALTAVLLASMRLSMETVSTFLLMVLSLLVAIWVFLRLL